MDNRFYKCKTGTNGLVTKDINYLLLGFHPEKVMFKKKKKKEMLPISVNRQNFYAVDVFWIL